MKLTLRVLTPLTENRHPDQDDIDALRHLAAAYEPGLGLDELACAVIQRALKRRSQSRASIVKRALASANGAAEGR